MSASTGPNWLVPVPSGGETYGDWDYISEGLDATLFPPKSLQSVLVCLPRCRKALTGAVCHIAFHQLSLVADFIYLQDPSPAAFRQISMAITRKARLNSIRYREEREYRYLPEPGLIGMNFLQVHVGFARVRGSASRSPVLGHCESTSAGLHFTKYRTSSHAGRCPQRIDSRWPTVCILLCLDSRCCTKA